MDEVMDQIITLLKEQQYGGSMTVPELLQECKETWNMRTSFFAEAIERLERGKIVRLESVIRPGNVGVTVVRLT